MGCPVLDGPKVPTSLAPTQGTTVVQQALQVEGRAWRITAVSMGNPHAIIYSVDGLPIKVGSGGSAGWVGGWVGGCISVSL